MRCTLAPARRSRLVPRTRQRGIYVVEFAIVSALFMFMVFGAIEVSRLMFVWSALDAATQRGARVAAVCPMNDPLIAQTATFGGAVVPELAAENIAVQYLNAAGGGAAGAPQVRYVQVSITNYQHQMMIPNVLAQFVAPLLTAPPFTTTRPRESLGSHPGGTPYC